MVNFSYFFLSFRIYFIIKFMEITIPVYFSNEQILLYLFQVILNKYYFENDLILKRFYINFVNFEEFILIINSYILF